ncbi:MAG: hypothetical protein Q9220_005097 [cf. Caloplaca sp. 1 TL-2023]
MVRPIAVPRTATFAWSPSVASTLLATGTRAGAVDADFSNDTQLELWDLAHDDAGSEVEIQPIASIDTDSRFHDIAWAHPTQDHPQGILAGALENGSLDLWSAENLLNGKSEAFLSRTSKHSGPIKALQFNPFRHELLATAGTKGELFISDLNNIGNPYRMGNSVARSDDFDCLDWNKNVPHIAVTGSSGGFVTVWDVKTKKESLTLNNMGRKAVSAVAWDPNKHTRLVTAIPQDSDPLILVWDLRNTNAPERVLRGHDGGVLSLSWCAQDNDLLLSCGKDNRTICWNPQSGEAYGEYPVVTNWTFQTRWNPHNPSFLATASFDGKITVQPLQSTHTDAGRTRGVQGQSTDDADFFNKTQSDSQGSSFSLTKAPKWLRRPCGASFGFGGKVVSFDAAQTGSTVRISKFAVDAGIQESSTKFEQSIKDGNLAAFCESRTSEGSSDSQEPDWQVIGTLTSQNPRKELIQLLGFSTLDDEASDGIAKLSINGDSNDGNKLSSKQNGISNTRHNRLSAFFENSGDGDNFLSDLAATKGAKINNPFQVYSGSESEADRRVTRALVLGQFDKALEVCLQEDRLSDAFMVAICGGQSCIEKAQKAYFSRETGGPTYLRLLASVVGKNLWDIVYNADLDNWKEVMATICTYADSEEYPDLCEALGDRLDERTRMDKSPGILSQDASLCYLAGSKLEKQVAIWISELKQREQTEFEKTSDESSFGIHARCLHHFIEKVTVFREATRFRDNDLGASSNWKLTMLYDKYTEYADLVASYGQLDIAERYLDLVPKQYPAAETARERIKQATRRPVAQTVPKQTLTPARTQHRNIGLAGSTAFESQPALTKPTPSQSNPYAPPSAFQSQPYSQATAAPYGSPGHPDSSNYPQNPQSRQPPMQYSQLPGPQYQNPSLGPPPRMINASPSVPAPSKAQNMGNWNDMPDSFFKPPTARRGTPGAPPPSSMNMGYGYPPAAAAATGPSAPPVGGQQRPTPPLPPPPKGPPRIGSPMTATPSNLNPPDRPSSSAANAYAPQQQSSRSMTGQQQQQQPIIPRGPSPYNPPPSMAPPSNRYAPAPQAPQENYPLPGVNRSGPPPPNPYTPQSGYVQAQPRTLNERTPDATVPASSGRPPPRSSAPPPAVSRDPNSEAPSVQQVDNAPASVRQNHPPGDRSHISSESRPIYDLLNMDMQRVKARAPANFQKQVNDTEKRLNILFDHLNNEDLLKEDTVASMVELSKALQARDYEHAQAIHLDLLTNKTDQCGQWMLNGFTNDGA